MKCLTGEHFVVYRPLRLIEGRDSVAIQMSASAIAITMCSGKTKWAKRVGHGYCFLPESCRISSCVSVGSLLLLPFPTDFFPRRTRAESNLREKSTRHTIIKSLMMRKNQQPKKETLFWILRISSICLPVIFNDHIIMVGWLDSDSRWQLTLSSQPTKRNRQNVLQWIDTSKKMRAEKGWCNRKNDDIQHNKWGTKKWAGPEKPIRWVFQ